MPKLYTHPFSTYGRRVQMMILEKQLDQVEIVTVDMPKGGHKSPDYMALNPYGRVPTLTDGDFTLLESSAIMEYLEETYPEPALIPADAQGRAAVRMHMKLCDVELAGPAYVLIFSKRFVPQDKWRVDEMQASQKQIGKHYQILEQMLEGKTFLVNETLTLADLAYAPVLHFSDLIDVPLGPNVSAYKTRLLARASASATVPPM